MGKRGGIPELYESLSRLLDRKISSPAWKNTTPCESATSAAASVAIFALSPTVTCARPQLSKQQLQ